MSESKPPQEPIVDLARLNAWPGLADVPGEGPVESLEPLKGGAQNLLFTMRRADGTELVLRRPGRHAGEEAVKPFARESRVLTALAGTPVPHPRLHASCLDARVIGAPFSVLEKIEGFMPRGDLPGGYGADPEWRRKLAFELVGGAASLAAVDPGAIGLGDLSRTDGWLDKQISRYLKMLHGYRETDGYTEHESPLVDVVAAWLEDNRPKTWHRGIVHGDLQFANVMFRHDAPELAAIVDWEMAAVGDPLLDLAWILTAWHEEGDPPGGDPQLRPWDGMPGRAELVGHWATLTGRDVADFRWFQVLACFRLAALLERSFVLALGGRTNRATGDGLHAYAGRLWAKAEQEIGRS
ncbi:phosphotransferase family protein [Actinomadura algeriensis]|uniref:Aminoglycoside phosphotransferase (APT) family kinase protein n=1 Tax=Actinomadura algeriensis TaxID=1679523 RepID=A0ABR9JYX2_9ACTN|nr:phosphotransferase family protein [Actinomadura algeriensis]MBE1535546.1 aminoglycoside phosphotransferase (APT) family kinase protein [Actinomadura algeriensis]